MLTALIPPTNLGLTTDARPTFWFYVPYARSIDVEFANFMLVDAAMNPVLEEPISVPLPASEGIVAVSLSSSDPALEVNQEYNWSMMIMCNPVVPERNPFVAGWIKRIPRNSALNLQLDSNSDQADYEVYANNDLWYNAITELGKERCQSPQNASLVQDWVQLLTTQDLTDIAEKPILCDELGAIANPDGELPSDAS